MDFWIPVILIGLGSLNIGMYLGERATKIDFVEKCEIHEVYIVDDVKLKCELVSESN